MKVHNAGLSLLGGMGGVPQTAKNLLIPPPPPLKNPPRRLLSIKFLFSLLNESMRGKSMQTEAKTWSEFPNGG